MPNVGNPSTYFGLIERANVNNWLDDVIKSNSQNVVFFLYVYIYIYFFVLLALQPTVDLYFAAL